MDIRPLDEQAARAWGEALASLDARTAGELGDRYSREIWQPANFAWPLPGKWELSFIAVDADAVLGFWVASGRVPGEVHVHRVAVAPEARGLGLGRRLFSACAQAAVSHERGRMTLWVGRSNDAALAFYLRLGFQVLEPTELAAFRAAHGRADEGPDAPLVLACELA